MGLKIRVKGLVQLSAIENCLSQVKCMALATVLRSIECPPRWNRQSDDPGEGWGGLTACKWKRLKRCADHA